MEDEIYWVWFSQIKKIGPIKKRKLLEIYKNPKEIWKTQEKELQEVEGIGEILAKEIVNEKYKKNLNSYLKDMEKENIELVTIYDSFYPEILKQIYDYPISLYVKGNKKLLNEFCLAIIGSRNNTQYGSIITKIITQELVKRGVNIISGLAIGIDGIAHQATIDAKGKTVAVLGGGLKNIYPTENTKLFNDIINQEGLIISEYPINEKANKTNFPARNRIISGISRRCNCNRG